jgi:hypothetical protein
MLSDMAGNIVAGWTAFCGAPQRVAGSWLLVAGRSIPAVNQQPATSNQQPATSNQQPATSNQQPATSRQQPIDVTKNTIVAGAMYAFG